MKSLSLITKIQTVINLIMSKNLYLMFLVLGIVLAIIFITTNGTNRKESKKAYYLLYLAFIIFILIQYGTSTIKLIDYAFNEVFMTYYFPNIFIYILILITANIILWKTLFKRKIDFKIKVINSISFVVIMYLFVLILSLITTYNIDVFKMTELYSNESIRALLELSMFIFVFWITVLAIYKVITKYQYKADIIHVEDVKNYNIIENFNIERAYKVETKKVEEDSKEKEIPATNNINILGQEFTLEEYRLVVKMLREEQERQKQQLNNENKEENALSELSKLYQTVQD